MSLPWPKCKSGRTHRTAAEVYSCPSYVDPAWSRGAVIYEIRGDDNPGKHGEHPSHTRSGSPSPSWVTVSDSESGDEDGEEQNPVNDEVSFRWSHSSDRDGKDAEGDIAHATVGIIGLLSARYRQRRNAICESAASNSTGEDGTLTHAATSPKHQAELNEDEWLNTVPEALAIPTRNTHDDSANPFKRLVVSHNRVVETLRDSTFLVQRLLTREKIALADRDRARIEAQRMREELDVALGRKKNTTPGSVKSRALMLLLVVFALLVAVQYANRTLYEPEFEWMAKMTRDRLGLD